jgi:hypothetical protein
MEQNLPEKVLQNYSSSVIEPEGLLLDCATDLSVTALVLQKRFLQVKSPDCVVHFVVRWLGFV